MTGQERRVDCWPGIANPLQKFLQALGQKPIRLEYQVKKMWRIPGPTVRRATDAAIAADHGGHPLRDLRSHFRAFDHRCVVVGVYVDKSGSDNQSGYVDASPRVGVLQTPNCTNAIAPNGDVRREARRPAAVNNRPVAQDQVIWQLV